ncbi:group 1 glycosyl transferase [Clostridium tetanomorphum DSM 665]|nr:group 1 glycosyl transferase [Clostridium tetanomorphum DSM 665]KAJ52979.1 group 1 glycosyl transferase [Clostridium tetanomorphum DSM 665]
MGEGINMKILLTSDIYLPSVNGVVTSIRILYKELKKRGNDVKILTLSPNGQEYISEDVYYLKSFDLKLYPGIKGSLSFKSSFLQELISWEPDVIHSHTEFITMHYANKISKLLKIPHFHTYHTMYEDYVGYIMKEMNLSKKAAALASKFAVRHVDKIIAPTVKVENALKSYGVKQPISVIPTGIDLQKFNLEFTQYEKTQFKKQLGIKENEKILLYLGRIGKEKNIEEIMENFSLSSEDKKLLIVGGGPYLDNLKIKVKELSLENKVIFTGMIAPQQVVKYYKISDVFLTASISETQGLTYLEALASGTPVICRKDDSNEGLIKDNFNGFRYDNTDSYLKALDKVLKENGKFRQNAIKSIFNYSKDIYGERVNKLYEIGFNQVRYQAPIVSHM